MPNLNKEQKLIAKIKDMLGPSGRFIGDDCAILPGKILVTTDTLVEQIHFRLEWTSFKELGWKAMSVNLSDIAAMAGIPKYALIVLSAPEDLYRNDKIISLYEGFIECAQQYQTAIVGGDITAGLSLSITITVIGEAHQAGLLMRSRAKAGDVVIVTGDFGASHAGLRILQNSANSSVKSEYSHCLQEFLAPKPKLQESWRLVEATGSRGALMDTSDGLADALLQLSQSSSVGMCINLNDIPIVEQTRKYAQSLKMDPLEFALYGGEDYQLLCCLPKAHWLRLQKESPEIQKSFKEIGFVTEQAGVQLMFDNEKAYSLDPLRIFQHIS